MGKFIDLKGMIFGELTVVSFSHISEKKETMWFCKCSCGKENILVRSNGLRNGHSSSCGCNRTKTLRSLNCIGFGESAFNKLFYNYGKNARNRNLEFVLNKNNFMEITSRNCYYCGLEPKQIQKANGNGEYIYNGIDRINSNLGYTLENCVVCCWRCNQAKNDEKQDDFKSWIEQVYNHFVKIK